MVADRLYGRASTDDVVQSVRRLRAERDQLRLRDRDHSRSMRQVGHSLVLLGIWPAEFCCLVISNSEALLRSAIVDVLC